MVKTQLVWRETVYKNGFKCYLCNTPLADKNGNPSEYGGVVMEDILLCPRCKFVCGWFKDLEVPEVKKELEVR